MQDERSYLDEIEGIIGKKLREAALGLSFVAYDQAPAYAIDQEGYVVGLNLDRQGLREIPDAVFRFSRLQILSICDTNLSTLPPRIGELTSLRGLYLIGTHIARLPSEIGNLTNLESLYIYQNKIRQLPRELGNLTKLRDLMLEGNPLESPPQEIADRGISAIRKYFESLAADETLLLNEVKLILVGDGGAGKTSLAKLILGGDFDPNEPQTHGININRWQATHSGRQIRVNLWDFGGQEIMHATHQFFLSERSLYVLVLDGRKEENPEYWLKYIESFGGESPILVVLNKTDENPGFDVNRRFLQSKYPGIVGFYRVSCKQNTGISDVTNALKAAFVDRVPILTTRWPKRWFKVKAKVEGSKQPYISYEQFEGLCKKASLTDDSAQELLLAFLHDLGVAIHFSDFRLRDTHVLNPRWLTGGVYRIINSSDLADHKGVLLLSSLSRILKPNQPGDFTYPMSKHAYLVDIMGKFELCFPIDERTVLVPDLLEVEEPEIDFDYADSLRFRIEYDFLPQSVMPRFMVKRFEDLKGKLRWRTGMVLADGAMETEAVVRADRQARRIEIFVSGKQRRAYLTVIRSTFREINRSFKKLDFVEKVVLPDNPLVTVGYDHLIRLEHEGIRDVYPDGAQHAYEVKKLLGQLYVEHPRDQEEFLNLLRKVVTERDTEESAIAKANDILMLQPNFFGLGINISNLVKRILKR